MLVIGGHIAFKTVLLYTRETGVPCKAMAWNDREAERCPLTQRQSSSITHSTWSYRKPSTSMLPVMRAPLPTAGTTHASSSHNALHRNSPYNQRPTVTLCSLSVFNHRLTSPLSSTHCFLFLTRPAPHHTHHQASSTTHRRDTSSSCRPDQWQRCLCFLSADVMSSFPSLAYRAHYSNTLCYAVLLLQ